MSEHTPGPWVATQIKSGNYLIQARGSCKLDIGEVWIDDDERDRPDALLIAAAPDLKEANYVLAMMALQSDRYATDAEYRDAVDAALAANAKAEGR